MGALEIWPLLHRYTKCQFSLVTKPEQIIWTAKQFWWCLGICVIIQCWIGVNTIFFLSFNSLFSIAHLMVGASLIVSFILACCWNSIAQLHRRLSFYGDDITGYRFVCLITEWFAVVEYLWSTAEGPIYSGNSTPIAQWRVKIHILCPVFLVIYS